MSNLFYLARSGLTSAQSALQVVGNNMNNAYVAGYNRQNIILGEAGGKTTAYGFFGYGVRVDDVQRAYDGFLANSFRESSTHFSFLSARNNQLSQIDNMLGDDTSNVSLSLDKLFKSLTTLSSPDADEAAARQGAYAQFKALADQFRSNSGTLDGLEKSTNSQIESSVKDINSMAQQLAELNGELNKIHGQTGGTPSDLLDKRDQLLSQLNDLVGVKVNEDTTTGMVNVTMSGGVTLVSGDRSYGLSTSPSASNPAETVVSYTDGSGNAIPLNEESVKSGKLGGLFKFRNEDLADARNQLNQLALKMANRFNEVNHAGIDKNGEAGGDLFSYDNPKALANRNNTGDGSFDVTYSDISQVSPQDYTITYSGGNWVVTRADGSTVPVTNGPGGELQFDGISMMPNGSAQEGDSFVMNSASGIAGSLNVAIDDGDGIAVASEGGEAGNNENINDMIHIQDEQLINNGTLTEAYAKLVSTVGSAASTLKGNLQTSQKTAAYDYSQLQSAVGVNIEEEFVNLQMFQQYYQANAQVLQTATTLFDTILNIK